MKPEELLPYLRKFITVELDDGTEESGFVANPEAFRDMDDPPSRISLLNGLFRSDVPISRIVSVTLPVREDTIQIPIVDLEGRYGPSPDDLISEAVSNIVEEDTPEDSAEEPEKLLKEEDPEEEILEEKIDEIYQKSLQDTVDIDLDSLLNQELKKTEDQ